MQFSRHALAYASPQGYATFGRRLKTTPRHHDLGFEIKQQEHVTETYYSDANGA